MSTGIEWGMFMLQARVHQTTALSEATKSGHTEIVKLLLAAGAEEPSR